MGERPVCTCPPEEALPATVCNKCFGDLETYDPSTHRVVPLDAVVLGRELAERLAIHANALQRREPPTCTECAMRKSPIGRDTRDNGMCGVDCPSYYERPQADAYWPTEVREDFARLRSALDGEG